MATVPNDRKYLESHEWHLEAGGVVTIGITQIAADELTDITFVQLPKVGTKLEAGKAFGEVESVKATSDLYSGVSGVVTEVNEKLSGEPGVINQDPYEKGWMIRVKKEGEGKGLLSSEDYLKKAGQ
jgi:glycine cleavage system H protein